eukprot:8167612-Alexandrium_andersonii.AAC.1
MVGFEQHSTSMPQPPDALRGLIDGITVQAALAQYGVRDDGTRVPVLQHQDRKTLLGRVLGEEA